jgi:outer membrane protein TolC
MQCMLAVKALVALTGLSEPELIAQLREQSARLPAPSAPPVPSVPAQALARRPDVAAAERELAAASAAIGVAEAQRYPRLALSGQISPTVVRPAGLSTLSVVPWSIGPALSLPLTGDAARSATVEAARAAYQAAEVSYRARVRQAVREVEEALLAMHAVSERRGDVRAAALGYREALAGAQSRQRAGLGSLIELEDARRTSLAADAAEAALDHEWLVAWINLYRALGGGWDGL